jgi:hypothetical protein
MAAEDEVPKPLKEHPASETQMNGANGKIFLDKVNQQA